MKHITILITVCVLFSACKRGFEPIVYGKDACAHCRMTIVDERFAAELITDKGRAYKFDDLHCMRLYIKENKVKSNTLYVAGFLQAQKDFLDATRAVYLKHESFTSPMNGNIAAFGTEQEAATFRDKLGVAVMRWQNLD